MAKQVRELSALEVKRLVKAPGFHAVGGVACLYLDVEPSGAASWILRTKVGDARPDIGLGAYPSVTLETARTRAREAHEQIRGGIDPREARRAARDSLRAATAKLMTFEEASTKFLRSKTLEFKNRKHAFQWSKTLEDYAYPVLGKMQVADIAMTDVYRALEPIWTTKTDTALRVRGRIEKVLDWAKVHSLREGENPARWSGNLEHAGLQKPSKIRTTVHLKAIPWQSVGAFMADLQKREGVAARALEFAVLTAARSGDVRLATWDEIDLDAKLWTIPGERMKEGKTHRVPLSAAAIRLLKSLPVMEGSSLVFPGTRGPLSDMSLTAVLRRMKVDATVHGMRSAFKDWCRSSTAYADEVSELALAHVNDDATRAAYARDELLPKRALLMRDWAKFCGTIPQQSSVTPIGKRQ